MSSISVFKIKEQLRKYNISFSEDESVQELRNKFNDLPITEGQIEYLRRRKVNYKAEFGWTRGEAARFIQEADEYFRLRDALPISPAQKLVFIERGIDVPEGITSGEAANIIYNLPPTDEQLEYIEKYKLEVRKGVELCFGYCQYIIDNREAVHRFSRIRSQK